jgi:hemin uptake protein HemP
MHEKAENQPYPLAGRAAVAIEAMPRRLPRITTDRLMQGHREIVVQHGREEYRLRITSLGKLILTK